MGITIRLTYPYGYPWFSSKDIFVKGYLFDKDKRIRKGNALISFFEEVNTEEAFRQKLKEANGIFSVIIKKDNQVFFAVDRTRTFPLFYRVEEKETVISDDAETAAGSRRELSMSAKKEFLLTGFVTGKDTLLSHVKQVQAGEYVLCSEFLVKSCFYHHLVPAQPLCANAPFLTETLQALIEETGERLVTALDGRTAVIPLSGGYDSRLIAVLLKKNNYRKVICYTYGIPSSPEVRISQKVAAQLGFPWYFIHYTHKLLEGFEQSAHFQSYFPFAGNYTSSFFLQDYFAVKYLKEHALIPENAVFVPGHTGDFLAGGHLTPGLNAENLIRSIFRKHFGLRKADLSGFREKIEDSLLPVDVYANYENWDLKERQAKFIINSNRIYEYWGFEHLMPLWDNALAAFFPDIGLKYRLNKKLYDLVLFRYYFNPNEVAFISGKHSFLIRKAIGMFNRLFRFFFTDNTNFKSIAKALLKDRKLDICWNSRMVNINSIQATWYLSRLDEKIMQNKESLQTED